MTESDPKSRPLDSFAEPEVVCQEMVTHDLTILFEKPLKDCFDGVLYAAQVEQVPVGNYGHFNSQMVRQRCLIERCREEGLSPPRK